MPLFSTLLSIDKVKELQRRTGKPYNECSSALNLADGDINQALQILRKIPEQSKRVKR